MSTHSYSLRERIDVLAGGMLFLVMLGGCLALESARQQRRHTQLMSAVHEQGQLVQELIVWGEALTGEPSTTLLAQAPHASLEIFREQAEQLRQHLRVFRDGGALPRTTGDILILPAVRDRRLVEAVSEAVAQLERYRLFIEQRRAPTKAPYAGQELRARIHALASIVESRSLIAVVRMSQIQLSVMVVGMLVFLLAVVFLRRALTIPLHRMADGIEGMRRVGRLVKLPIIHANELGVVANGFNELSAQVEEQKQRLREHIVELQRANTELDQLANLKDDFLTTINHQLRTPLTAIIGGVELLAEGASGPVTTDQHAVLESMQQNARQLEHLVEEALDLSLLKSGRRPLRRQPGDLAQTLRQAITRWQAAAQSRTLQLTCSALPDVYMDTEAIGQVMDHLLHNAIRHTPERGTITVQARVEAAMVRVSVTDQGPGMSARQLEQLFQPFSHVHTPDAPGSQGGGLGLAFCDHVLRRHRGTIDATSEEGRGTTLTFALPIAAPHFLFEEACRMAHDEAKHERGTFAVLVVTASGEGESGRSDGEDVLRRAEPVLRRSTHRGDQFVWVDAHTLVIVAVTDPPGLQALMTRLRGIVQAESSSVCLRSALAPHDGHTADALLASARAQACGVHAHGPPAAHASAPTRGSDGTMKAAPPTRLTTGRFP